MNSSGTVPGMLNLWVVREGSAEACILRETEHVSDLALLNKSLLLSEHRALLDYATPSYHDFSHPVYHETFFTHLTQIKLHRVQRCVSEWSWAVPRALHFEPFTQ